jgi:putative membrane protein
METIALALLHRGDFDGGGFGGPPLFFLPFMFLFWILILGGLAWAALRVIPRWREGGGGWPGGGGRRDPAEEILRERFARGETSAEEYTRALNTLRGDGPADYEDYVREAEEGTDPNRGPNS